MKKLSETFDGICTMITLLTVPVVYMSSFTFFMQRFELKYRLGVGIVFYLCVVAHCVTGEILFKERHKKVNNNAEGGKDRP